jgi:mono/diheme cytochrome c family protein
VRVVVGLVLAALAALGCEEPVPAAPSYALDVKPLFHAHCVRCHGAGGTLNADQAIPAFGPPSLVHLDSYEDTGVGCPPLTELVSIPDTCNQGAHRHTVSIGVYVHLTGSARMPPPPAPRLTEWELALVDRWVANPLP